VRKFFDCYTNGRPEDFDECVAPDYVDYGHASRDQAWRSARRLPERGRAGWWAHPL